MKLVNYRGPWDRRVFSTDDFASIGVEHAGIQFESNVPQEVSNELAEALGAFEGFSFAEKEDPNMAALNTAPTPSHPTNDLEPTDPIEPTEPDVPTEPAAKGKSKGNK